MKRITKQMVEILVLKCKRQIKYTIHPVWMYSIFFMVNDAIMPDY